MGILERVYKAAADGKPLSLTDSEVAILTAEVERAKRSVERNEGDFVDGHAAGYQQGLHDCLSYQEEV